MALQFKPVFCTLSLIEARLLSGTFCLKSQIRCSTNKHFDPKWRRHRWAKFVEIDLPDFDKIRREAKMDPSEVRSKMKKEKIPPPRSFKEREIILACTNAIFEAYVPPEGDGVASIMSSQRAQQSVSGLKKKGTSLASIRKIKKYEDDFDTKEFPNQAQEIYIEAHNCLNDLKNNEDRLHQLVSEKAYPEMTWKLEKKTVRWNFIKSLEPPRIVHARATELLNKNNLYGQVTVRFHTQQTLAVYDRFGRLLYGSEHLIKDCLEYIVFEKRITELYSLWRIHGKIVPTWMPKSSEGFRTKRMPDFEPIEDEEEESAEKGVQEATSTDAQQPQVATA